MNTDKSSFSYLKINPDNIPQSLKDLKQWAVWKPIKSAGSDKPGKIPLYTRINPLTNEPEVCAASVKDPATWMTFDEASKMLKSSAKFKGLQFMFPCVNEPDESTRLVGVDLDNTLLPDGVTIKPEILEIIDSFSSYTELSPSGQGIRIFCYGNFPFNERVHRGNFEIYQSAKILTVTGHKLVDSPGTIENAQEAVTAFRAKYFKPFPETDETNLPVTPVDFTDSELLDMLLYSKPNPKFKKLYYDGANDGDDLSELDLSLCRFIVFFTQKPEQIDRIFRESALMRDKWDRKTGSDANGPTTYGMRTINFALKTRKFAFRSKPIPLNTESFDLNLYPFSVNENGIYREVQNKSGDSTTLQIASTPCIITAVGKNIDNNGKLLYKLKIKNHQGQINYVWKSTSELMERTEIIKLHEADMRFLDTDAHEIMAYFDKYTQTHKKDLVSECAASKGGWKENFSVYVLGNKIIVDGKVKEILQLENPTSNHFGTKGDMDLWVKGAKVIASYPAVRFKMYSSGIPALLRLLYISPFVLENCVKSGQLKSISNWLTASMWGDPIAQQAGGNSTPVGILNLISYCVDIPTFLDETSQNPELARKLVYSVGNLSSRIKGKTNGMSGIDILSAVSTVLLMTGENSIIEDNANGGEEVRVLRLREGVTKRLPDSEVGELERLIRENYGHIGIKFIQELFKLKDKIRSIYDAYREKLPDVEDISSNRVKRQYAVATTAGYIFEIIFKILGFLRWTRYMYVRDSLKRMWWNIPSFLTI
jgi:uncharacterized protein (DUF927 family)